jgi:hypothetical protein
MVKVTGGGTKAGAVAAHFAYISRQGKLELETDEGERTTLKAEGDHGKRLYIDKPMLREWRENFARMMREQGIAANPTPRVVRGRNKGKAREGIFRARPPPR